MKQPKVAVAISVYKSDTAHNLSHSIDSILGQSYQNFKVFLQVDGPVSVELMKVIESYSNDHRIHVTYHEQNKGLATRLNNVIDLAIKDGSFQYIARMDADDICSKDRFQKQLDYFSSHNDVLVIGSDVIEINTDGEHQFYKSMPQDHDDLYNNIIKKCPFNHPSVMFDIRVFSEFGHRYKNELSNTQDYYLWIDLLSSGIKFGNINEPLLLFRIDSNFHKRRGLKKALNDTKSRIYAINKLNLHSFKSYFHTLLLFGLRLSPEPIKKLAYKHLR